jgi:hypothetical protein
VYTDPEIFTRDAAGRCTSFSCRRKKGFLCLFHADKKVPKEHPQRQYLEEAQALTNQERADHCAVNNEHRQKEDVQRHNMSMNQKWKRGTDFNKTPERRIETEQKAAERRALVRAAHDESVVDMMQRHPNDWQTRITAINTDAQTNIIVAGIEATPVNELHSLCTQRSQLLLSTIDDPVKAVLNGNTTMSYIGLSANSSLTQTCQAPRGQGIMCGQVSRLRWNCSAAVRQSDYVDGRCSSTQ